jgi:uncharacterized ion transporter superfamily protein YfcC
MGAESPPLAAASDAVQFRETVRVALRWDALRRTLRIALVVGTIFTVLNQAGAIVGGRATVTTWLRVAANYIVPLCVSTFGYVSAVRQTHDSHTR